MHNTEPADQTDTTSNYASTTPADHNYLLIKHLPTDVTEEAVRAFFSDCTTIESVLIVKNSNNV